MKKPICIDLFCGLGGWSEGFLAEGYECIGFDIERHDYGRGGYPGQLVLQDIMTLHGSQFRNATCMVASPPCQEFSYMAMPWTRGKRIAEVLREGGVFPAGYVGSCTRKELTALFDACFRIQREACAAAGRHIPMVVENVRGAQPWVGRSAWNFGSFHLWGDVPALMPIRSHLKVPGFNFHQHEKTGEAGGSFQSAGVKLSGQKNSGGGSWFAISHGKHNGKLYGDNPVRGAGIDGMKTKGHVNKRDGHGHTRHLTNQRESEAVKQPGLIGEAWFDHGAAAHSSKSLNRKAASAEIAKIPFALSQHIARVYKP